MTRLMKIFVRQRCWVYLFPFLMDFSIASFSFYSVIRAGQLGASPFVLGMVGSAWGITYFLASLFLSRTASQANSETLMKTSCGGFILLAGLMMWLKSLPALAALLTVSGVFTACFFVSFQLFMGASTNLPCHRSVAFYTVAWSWGLAFGFLCQGFLVEHGAAALLPIVTSAVLVLVGLQVAERVGPGAKSQEPVPAEEAGTGRELTVFVYVGWLSIFTVGLLGAGLKFLMPKFVMDYLKYPAAVAGTAMFVVLVVQGAVGCLLAKVPRWRYRFAPHFWMKAVGILGFVCLWLVPNMTGLVVFGLCVGAYSGNAFYSSVFYSINHPSRSGRNIGINEALVGISSVLGPLLLGAGLEVGRTWFLFLPVAILLVTLLVQKAVLTVYRGCSPGQNSTGHCPRGH